jgi:hypothetical protein
MDTFLWLAVIIWATVVSFAAALKIKSRAIAILAAVCASVFIPLALGVLITSLIPIASLGPEEFLQKYWDILIGAGAIRLPVTLLCVAIGAAAGFTSVFLIARRHTRR